MIIAHGIDIVDIADTQRKLAALGIQYLSSSFTTAEQEASDLGLEQAAKLSGRFAIKEAVMKALGTGFGSGVGFLDVETVGLPSGAPSIRLHRGAESRAKQLGITRWVVSTSHEGGLAIASVIALGD